MIQLRKPTEEDISRFKECLLADPDHCNQDADAWTTEPGEFMVFYDQDGNRVWVRLERTIRLHFQHDPAAPKAKIQSLIYKGMRWVIGSARNGKYSEVIFESRAPRLIHFLEKLCGAKPVEGNYCVRT
jgi:hypothetical protein